MDPLSDVFGLLQVKAVLSARFEAGGDWAVHFAPQPQIKFGAALRGSCWLTLHGGEPGRLEAGPIRETQFLSLGGDTKMILFARAPIGV